MADELNIITKNRAGDGWVDQIPGPVSSGYQAQNTLISSTLIGIDKSEVSPATQGRVIVEPSGPIDVDGQPFMVTSRVTLSPPDRNGGYYYIKVANGSTWNKKTLMAVTPVDPPLYDHARRGLYLINSDGTRERCLNWMVYYPNQVTDSTSNSRPFRIAQPGRPRLQIENFLDINGTETDFNVRFAQGMYLCILSPMPTGGTISNNLEDVLVNTPWVKPAVSSGSNFPPCHPPAEIWWVTVLQSAKRS